jgi:hypothetical protein
VPEWSSDATYPAGSDPWSATDTKIEPTTGEVEAGATPKTGFGAQQFNWLLNNHASALIWLMKAVTGQAILVQDEFTGDPGDTVPDTIWEATNAAAGVLPAYIDDSAAGASGSAAFVLSNAGSSRLNAKIVVGTSDFYVRCRVRRATSTGSAEVITVGFWGAGAFPDVYFRSTSGGNWFAKRGGSTTDTGIAADTDYHWLEIERRDGEVEFRIDGVIEYSGTFADDLDISDAGVYVVDATANACEYRVDCVTFIVDRA